nr:hypothetical protein GCM10020092_050160 [Actinoplanes digitatis]
MSQHAWIDASAGVAGDMLLGALLDAGAGLEVVRRAIDEVLPGSVALSVTQVTRAGLRALKADVDPLVAAPPHRTWRDIRPLLEGNDDALAVFGRLVGAEARVHGTEPEEVHFHEVGALDSIADVVGVCAALRDLGVTSVSAGEVALGSGRVRTAHGELPVPAPAVLELARGWRVSGGGGHELATPTGLAVIRALATRCEDLPPMTVDAVGVGAGGRDTPGRANVVRVVIGAPEPGTAEAVVLEANVDDLDPRLWPGVLAGLLSAGADDAWLVPILMKKGPYGAHAHGAVPPGPGRRAAGQDLPGHQHAGCAGGLAEQDGAAPYVPRRHARGWDGRHQDRVRGRRHHPGDAGVRGRGRAGPPHRPPRARGAARGPGRGGRRRLTPGSAAPKN